MRFETFKMERMQSTYENAVSYNLSESGVHPLTLRELVTDEVALKLLDTRLGYGHTNGTPELRQLIAGMYEGCAPENILVTNGSSEANFISFWSLVDEGDEVIFMIPNYMQIGGLARTFGARITDFNLLPEESWRADLNQLNSIVSRKTRLIAICNPNNPTGSTLSKQEMMTIRDIAADSNAWILSDEVYRGAELDGNPTPSFLEIYDKALVTCGLSKAYGLPGLRIGWVAGPKDQVERAWSRHDYTTIGPSALSDRLAVVALSIRDRILERTRNILRTNLSLLDKWIREQRDLLSYVMPKAGAIAFVKYALNVNSSELTDGLRRKKNLLAVPGDHFGVDGYIRIGYGSETEYLVKALSLLEQYLEELSG
jgi:aspartate/methionine/tyrosine aminotransferase